MSNIPYLVQMSLRILEYSDLPPGRIPSEQALKDKYRALARRHHPDRGGSHEAMAVINRAYKVVTEWCQEVRA